MERERRSPCIKGRWRVPLSLLAVLAVFGVGVGVGVDAEKMEMIEGVLALFRSKPRFFEPH